MIVDFIYSNLNKISILFFLSFLGFVLLIKTNHLFRDLYPNQVQKIHAGSVSRNGGALIFTILISYAYYFEHYENLIDLIFFIPILTVSIVEDNYHNVKARTRFLVILLSSLIYVIYLYTNNILPSIELLEILQFINSPVILIIIMTLSSAALINGSNMIDGANGLCAFTFFVIFSVMMFIANKEGDLYLVESLFISLIVIGVFIIFNYPNGKIFLGDTGAYLLGFMSFCFFLHLIQRNEVPAWSSLALFFYPIIEVTFSFFRKIFMENRNPMIADENHLHLIFYRVFLKSLKNKMVSNCMVTFALALIWLAPPLFTYIFYEEVLTCLFAFFISMIIYFSVYRVIYKKL